MPTQRVGAKRLPPPAARSGEAASTDLGEVGGAQPAERASTDGCQRLTPTCSEGAGAVAEREGLWCPHRPVLAPSGLRASCLPQIPCSRPQRPLRAEWGRPSRSPLKLFARQHRRRLPSRKLASGPRSSGSAPGVCSRRQLPVGEPSPLISVHRALGSGAQRYAPSPTDALGHGSIQS